MLSKRRNGCTLSTKKSEGKDKSHSRDGKLSVGQKTIIKEQSRSFSSKSLPWKLESMGKSPFSSCDSVVALTRTLTLTFLQTSKESPESRPG